MKSIKRKKKKRLFYILNRLDTGKSVTTRELSEEFGVTYRTVQRDLQLLNITGFPIVSSEKGYHSFLEGFSLKKMLLTKEEATLLTFLNEITKSLGDNFEDSFHDILKKVISKEHESPFYAKIPDGLRIKKDYVFTKELEDAIGEKRKIILHYKTDKKEGDYKVHPLKIVFYDGFWYLLVQVDGTDKLITLRLENIKELEILDEHFTPRKDLNTILDESINVWFSGKRDKKVTLKVDKEAARYFKQRVYFPLQKITKENKDESLRIETIISQYEEIIPIIFRWIPYVHVIEPKDLKKEIKKKVTEYLKKALSY